jgi:hypothetical protein
VLIVELNLIFKTFYLTIYIFFMYSCSYCCICVCVYLFAGEKVYIAGHVAPGTSDFYSECSVRFSKIINRFDGIIIAQLYGESISISYLISRLLYFYHIISILISLIDMNLIDLLMRHFQSIFELPRKREEK